MGIVWVTGEAGSGKSAVCEVLTQRGHWAIDADWEGYNHWVHRQTHEVVVDPPYPAPVGWLGRFGWRIDVAQVAELARHARSTAVFLCGSVENEAEVWHLFSQVVCLVADDDTISERLAMRTSNEFGKHPAELAAVVAANRDSAVRYQAFGAGVLDATRPLEEVVDRLVSLSGAG